MDSVVGFSAPNGPVRSFPVPEGMKTSDVNALREAFGKMGVAMTAAETRTPIAAKATNEPFLPVALGVLKPASSATLHEKLLLSVSKPETSK